MFATQTARRRTEFLFSFGTNKFRHTWSGRSSVCFLPRYNITSSRRFCFSPNWIVIAYDYFMALSRETCARTGNVAGALIECNNSATRSVRIPSPASLLRYFFAGWRIVSTVLHKTNRNLKPYSQRQTRRVQLVLRITAVAKFGR